MGTVSPEGFVYAPVRGVGGNEELCDTLCMGGTPKAPRPALDEVGVRPGTVSKYSGLDGDGELYAGSKPRLARCVDEIGNA